MRCGHVRVPWCENLITPSCGNELINSLHIVYTGDCAVVLLADTELNTLLAACKESMSDTDLVSESGLVRSSDGFDLLGCLV